jgi:demethylmenaquinone methyltransferase/2-methoxy-6-polyprenyl-1,4-benzoquinol methylase
MSNEPEKPQIRMFGRNPSMKGRSKFEDSPIVNFVFEHMLHLLDSPIRRWFNDPVKTLKAAGVRPGLEVLEVGCGTGFFTIQAAKMVGDEGCVHAFDIHPLAVERVAEKIQNTGLRNVRLTKTDALETELPGESYDLILLFGVIPAPVLPLNKLLPEMHRLLRTGGSMAVWTGLPLWSPRQVTKSGLFTHVGKRKGVHNFTRNG